MMDINQAVRFLITCLIRTKLLLPAGLFVLLVNWPFWLNAQAAYPARAIKEMKEGSLVVRFPSYQGKIDTLTAMAQRNDDPDKKARLEKQIKEAMEERDTLQSDYVRAFKNEYHFSKVAYFFDTDAHNLNTASYYNLDGERISVSDLSEYPLFYLYFERTEDGRLDALVIYDWSLRKVPDPFPNNFSRSGINFLFLKIADKKFSNWRVGKMDKRLTMFWEEVN